ncbi:uncharacterized protein LOC133366751 [Rhineura floridana]|uniref:uncharacterized protein LOC133366751 n=1 Tax=Rhineura floridana TaxID=261503 RepID=UPI002AC8851B|nr:uncharacterized protein LOC133366751 [Rhineura floridana]
MREGETASQGKAEDTRDLCNSFLPSPPVFDRGIRAGSCRRGCSLIMASQRGSCQEVGHLLALILGSLVFLCVANNAILLVRAARMGGGGQHDITPDLPPPTLGRESTTRPFVLLTLGLFLEEEARRPARWHAADARLLPLAQLRLTPRRSKRKDARREQRGGGRRREPTSSREGGRPQPPQRLSSDCRCFPRQWADVRPAAPEAQECRTSRTGPDGSPRDSKRAAVSASGRRSEPSSAARLQQQQQQQQRLRHGRPGQPGSRSASPRRGSVPAARPAKFLILQTKPKGRGREGGEGGEAKRGRVIYDARWLHCMAGEDGEPALA